MKTIRSFYRSFSPRHIVVLAIMAFAVIVPTTMYAWGPTDRPLYKWAQVVDHVTFNSMIDNPRYGDERQFVKVRNVTDNGSWSDSVALAAGKEYEVRVHYHNNAAPAFNDAAHQYKGVARGAYLQVQPVRAVKAGGKADVSARIGATNAAPQVVWDEASFTNPAAQELFLEYVPGSAKIHNKGALNGTAIDFHRLTTSRLSLGYDALDGNVPGCSQFEGEVVYRVKVAQPSVRIEKTVNQAKSATVEVNTPFKYAVKVTNTGKTPLSQVVVSDKQPAGITFTSAGEGTIKHGEWRMTLAHLPAGASKQVMITAVATEAKTGAIINTACVDTPTIPGTPDGCDKATVQVRVKVCNIKTGVIETILANDQKADIHTTDLSRCDKVKVCDVQTKTTVIVTKKAAENTARYGSIDHPACQQSTTPPVAPTTPTELPRTGGMGNLLGVVALVVTATAYAMSRRITIS